MQPRSRWASPLGTRPAEVSGRSNMGAHAPTRGRGGAGRAARLLTMVLLVLVGCLPARLALAHAELGRSEPAANASVAVSPKRIQLWFSEEVDPSFTEAQVLDRNGNRMDRGGGRILAEDPRAYILDLPGELPVGTYTVVWKALSAVDGHVTRGGFAFGVGEAVTPGALGGAAQTPGSAVEPVKGVARWLSLVGALLLGGGFLFLALIWLPIGSRGRAERNTETQPLFEHGLSRVQAVMVVGVASLALGNLVLLLAQAVDLGEGSAAAMRDALVQVVLGTRFGLVWLARTALLAGLLALALRGLWSGPRLLPASRGPLRNGFLLVVPGRRAGQAGASGNHALTVAWVGTGLSTLLLLTFSLLGHGGGVGAQPGINVLVDWVHLLAAAAWIGSLVHLVAVVPLLLSVASRSRRAILETVLARFSALALAGGGLLAATGLYSATLHVPDLLALADTVYGNGVLVKVVVLMLLSVLGATNLLFLIPRLAAGRRAAEASRWGRVFRGVIAVEVALGALALGATAVVTSTSPARQVVAQPAARPWQDQQAPDDLRVKLQVAPLEPGFGRYTVDLRDRRDRPVEAERVTLRFTMLDHDMGVQEATTVAPEPGVYVADGSYLGMTGRWQVDTLVRRPGMDDTLATFTVAVPAVSPGKQAAQSVSSLIVDAPLVAAELTVLGLLLALAAWRAGGAATRSGIVVLGLAGAVLLAAGFTGATAQLASGGGGAVAAAARNPYPADERSLSIGREVYQQNCLVCHGPTGRGDGPASVGLRPRPADFEVHLRAGHTDADLYGWVTGGVPGTAMPAFPDRLTEEERWHVLNYIKDLVKASDR